ncbi:MAG TPA: twin-arginine translocase TatA/TatE family subunit [Actinomycetota bacterium]|nr:twin-arginine translocase TatA/TatE family subunit [Actinomycetota bacterium]
MPQIGPLEIMVVAIVALVVFGPQKLPEIARTVGRTLNELRRIADDVKGEFQAGLVEDEEPVAPDTAVPPETPVEAVTRVPSPED